MTKVLYLGNKFFKYKKVKSVLETLEPLLAEFCDIKTASDKKNQFLRFLDMLYHFFKFGGKADKIIIDVYSTKAFYFAYFFSILSWMFNKEYILFLHGGNLPFRYQQSKKMVTRMFTKAHKIIAPSGYLKDFFEANRFSVELVPNTIELDNYPFKLREKIRPHILALRGFGKPYNPLMALRAINELKNSIPDLKILLLGNENDFFYNDVISYVDENHLSNIVTVKPKCTRDEWVDLSKDYDIMVSNPMIDNTPVSLIEGMALGMCIISTNVGGVPYIINHKVDGLIIENNNVDDLVSSILFIINNSHYSINMSQNARLQVENYSWENVKPLWMNLINN